MKRLSYLIIAIVVLSTSSCKDLTEGFNDNPNAFTDVPANLVIGQLELQTALILNGQPARFAGIFTDQFTGADRQYIAYNNYTVIGSDFDDTWDRIYNIRAQAKIIEERSTDKIIIGRAQILEAIALAEGAALFGDIPYSEANQPGEFPNPKYDSQDQVMGSVQTILDAALVNVGTANIQGSVFVNNGTPYSRIIHSLKARYYLISKDYANALSSAQKGLTLSDGGFLVRHSSTNNSENLFWQFGVEQRAGYLTVISSHLRKLLQGETSRALPTPGSSRISNVYFDGEELNYVNSKSPFSVSAPGEVMRSMENIFIMIEALARTGNEVAARTEFNKVREYLASTYSGEFPPTSSTGTQLMKEILEEKYILMPGSIQIFHDVRRTKNLIGIPIKNSSSSKIPQRFIYPQSEKNTNKSFPGFIDLFEETPANKG